MLLLFRQLPAGPISLPALPTYSSSSLLLSLLASLLILSLAYSSLRLRKPTQPTRQDEKVPARSEWSWKLFSWDRISAVSLSLPVTLTPIDKASIGKGVGLRPSAPDHQQRSVPDRWQPARPRRGGGPTFETPLPALYQSEEPLSMAKMIMSRHTYRKPTNRPPPRIVIPPTRKVPSPPPSLVPPPPSSPPPTVPSNPPSMV